MLLMVQSTKDSLIMLKKQYDSFTKGLRGWNLLNKMSTIVATTPEKNKNGEIKEANILGQSVKEAEIDWGIEDKELYKNIQEMKAAETGIYVSKNLDNITNQVSKTINHLYTEAEISWGQLACSVRNLETLNNVKPQNSKQAKDLYNLILIENSLIEVNKNKVNASILMMSSSFNSYKIQSKQLYEKFINGKK